MNVAEFSKRVGTSPHTIRYYDKAGLFDDIRRLASGHRCFCEKDVVWFEFIQRLKETGMSIGQIRAYAELRRKGKETLASRQAILKEHSYKLNLQIQTQQQHLEKLNEKINLYQCALKGKIALD
ncbi:MerR family transcriptional regulator [Aliiglaciecola aliphaticivorans]